MRERLIYILNNYSSADSTHFPHVVHLLQTMVEQGSEVVLIVEKATEALPQLNRPGARVLGLRVRVAGLRQLELFFRVVLLILSGYKITFVRITASAAIVAGLAHRLVGGRSFLWQSGTTFEHDLAQRLSFRKLRWWFTSYLPNVIARRVTHHLATGPEYMVQYYAKVAGVPRKKIRLLYNDIDVDRFASAREAAQKSSVKRHHGIPESNLVLLLVHRLSPVRRSLQYLDPLLRALRQECTRPWSLVVAGDGSELGAARRMVDGLGLANRVHFLGAVPNREIELLYGIADVFLHPTFTEGFPRVIIEAMAAGVPIVSTDAGGTSELLGERQRNYVASRHDPVGFASTVISLINTPSDWDALSRESRAAVRKFSTAAVARMYRETLFSPDEKSNG